MMGALPFLAMFALELLPRRIFEPRNFIAAGAALCFIPIALYLTIDAGAVPHEFLVGVDGFGWRYVTFLAIEIPQVAVVAFAWRKVEPSDRRILLLAIALLFAIPTFSFGLSNDFVMRVSIPPLFLLAFAFARVATLTPRDNGPFATVIAVIVILSFATPMLEIKQGLRPSYAISDCNFLTSWNKYAPTIWPTNYLARLEAVPEWIVRAGDARVTIENRQCWPDHPLLDDARK
jgi:hypothetical protein